MKAYFRLLILVVLFITGMLSACNAREGTPAISSAASATQTVTVTEYSPLLPFITSAKPYSVLECSYSILSQIGEQWDFGWTLSIRNNTREVLPINATVQLLYETGYQVAAHQIPETVTLAAESQQTLTGHLLVDSQNARQVRSITAFIKA